MSRWIIWAVMALAVMPLLCINITTAGIVSESDAEFVHGTLNAMLGLWALRLLRPLSEAIPA